MKFIKLHQNGEELLVNMRNVAVVYTRSDNKSVLGFNFEVDGKRIGAFADESLDEVLELIKQVSE